MYYTCIEYRQEDNMSKMNSHFFVDPALLDQIQRNSIIPSEVGIRTRKGAGFVFTSDFAKENLFYISWEGLYECEGSYSVTRSYQDCYHFFQVLEGCMEISYFGKQYRVEKGDSAITDLHYPHSYYAVSDYLVVRQMMVHGPIAAAYYAHITSPGVPKIYHNNSKISYLMRSIEEELMKDFHDEHQVSILIQSVFAIGASESRMKISDPVEQVKDYIRAHYTEDISLDQVAKHVSLNKSYLSRLFKKETNSTPWDFLISLRLKKAMRLLTSTNDSIESIGAACGFNSTSHFIRCFKSELDITPKQFRNTFSLVPKNLDPEGNVHTAPLKPNLPFN